MDKNSKIALGVLALAGGAAVAYAIASGGEAQAQPPPPTGQGVLSATSVPSGATATIVQTSTGASSTRATPFNQTLPTGNYTITFNLQGYQTYTQNVTIVDGKTAIITANLIAVSPTSGTLPVAFSPANATVTINGNAVVSGISYTFAPGTYPWTASASGYVTQSGSVVVNTGNNPTLQITLQASGGGGGGGGPEYVTGDVLVYDGLSSAQPSANNPAGTYTIAGVSRYNGLATYLLANSAGDVISFAYQSEVDGNSHWVLQ